MVVENLQYEDQNETYYKKPKRKLMNLKRMQR